MEKLTEAERERLEARALELAAQNYPSHAIVVGLRDYCLEYGIEASDSERFVIADRASSRRLNSDSSKPVNDSAGLTPRSLKDRRKRERRQGPRRAADRRRTGLSTLADAFRRMGQPERRSGRDRRSSRDRRQVIRRRRVRRQNDR